MQKCSRHENHCLYCRLVSNTNAHSARRDQRIIYKKVKEEEPSHHFLPGNTGLNCQGDVIFLSEVYDAFPICAANLKKTQF